MADDLRSGRWKDSLPGLAAALLVIVFAWELVQLAETIYGMRGAKSAGPAASAPAMRVEPAVDLQAIVNAHLFGVAGAGVGGDAGSVAATQMNLVLVGTIAESDPEKGYAIIGESATSAHVYTVGKTISGGTKLHAVYPDRVILDRGGRLEALMLPRKFQGGGASPPAYPGATGAMGASGASLSERLSALAESAPTAIVETLRPQPVFADGRQRGYRVYPGRNRAQFTQLGLMPGDLITAINGAPLDDPARGMEVLQSMNSAASVTVTVERNGQPTQITINNVEAAARAAAAAAMPEPVPVTEIPASPGPQDDAE